MKVHYPLLAVMLAAGCVVALGACTQKVPVTKMEAAPVELGHYPLDTADEVLTKSDVALDTQVTSDGKGSLRLEAKDTQTFNLFEVPVEDVDNSRLVYQAKVRSEDVQGKAYLEMLVHFPEKGEFFSRGLGDPLTGTVEWTTRETPFFLDKGEKPDYVKLNLLVEGPGTVWVDDVRLTQVALNQ